MLLVLAIGAAYTWVARAAIVARDDTAAACPPPIIPVYYSYGGYPRIMADISWGTPRQDPVPTVMDLGSANLWVYGPNATVNYGTNSGIGAVGPCNVTANPAFNNTASRTATRLIPADLGYAYGGNGKLVQGYGTVNDTMHFGNPKVPALENRRTALSNFTTISALYTKCDPNFAYDHSILGLSAYKDPTFETGGPSFRQDLFDTGLVQSNTLSMWFDAPPSNIKGTHHGTVMFGAIPESKYTGPLVKLKPSPPDQYVGYYIPAPTYSIANYSDPTAKPKHHKSKKSQGTCLIDSGTGIDYFPINMEYDAFLNATGLVDFGGYPSWNGTCDSIPKHAALNVTWTGISGENVTISMPLRNYARGISDYLNQTSPCSLSLQIDSYENCILGAPFHTAMFLAVNDDPTEIAIAQGGVSSGAQQGVDGLGMYTILSNGSLLPGV